MCALRIYKPEQSPTDPSEPPPPTPTRYFGALPMPPPTPGPRPMVTATPAVSPDGLPRPRMRAILDSLYEAVFVTDLNGTIVEVNSRAEHITQLSQRDLIHQSIASIIPTLTDEILYRAIEHLRSTHHAIMEGWCRQEDGGRMRVEIAISRVLSPNRQELVFSLRNNTRQYSAKLQHINERLMLQHVACGIALVDFDSTIQYVNSAFLSIWRYANQDGLIGKKAQEMWPPEVALHLMEPLVSATPWSGEVTVAMPGGDTLWFQANSVPYQNRDGVTEGVVVSFIDTSALKVAEATIRREAELQMETARHEGNFAGSLNILSVPDLIQLITSSNKTGTLEIMDAQNQETAYASFDSGRMVCACRGETKGEPAVEKILEQGGRLFRFRQDVIRERDPSITRGTMGLLLDALRIMDEKKEASGRQAR